MEKKQESQEMLQNEKVVTIEKEEIETKEPIEGVEIEEETKNESQKKAKEQENKEPRENKKEQEVKEQTAVAKPQKKPKKKKVAEEVAKLKEMVAKAYGEHERLMDELTKSEEELIHLEDNVLKNSINQTLNLLKELKVDNLQELRKVASNVANENKEELLQINEPSKGRVGGFFAGALATIATASALGIYGAKIANLPLNTATFMQKENLAKIAQSYLEHFHIQASPLVGELALGAMSLLAGVVVYKFVTFLKALKNKQEIKKLQEKSQEYIAKLEKKNEQIKTILEHLEKVKSVTKKYDIILQEQNAKIKRMLFIEQPQNIEDLHKNSRLEVEKTILILDEFLKLMNTPVLKENGSLNQDSITALKSANIVINEVIKNLY